MRFYEYEAKALFARHGTPLLKGRVAKTAAEAKQIASEIGGPLVLKSQVLTGGRMKPGGVLVEERAAIKQEYFAAVTWDGRRKLPVVIFSDMGGIDIEEVAEK